ncbi:MAG: nucleotide sugar dehydrogenase, partial [Syntrophobacterales bacterium CG_4_8_14_3_um_filter_49_14]
IGVGYVGLPLALHFLEAGFSVTGFDIDSEKVNRLNKGESYIRHIPSSRLIRFIRLKNSRGFVATTDMGRISEMDAILICVPTPLTNKREPDMQYIENTGKDIAKNLRVGQLISVESTTYPGTTRELLLPLFESDGLEVGKDFYLIYSPEREDPGNKKYNTKTIPKVVGGITKDCLEVGVALYSSIVEEVVSVSTTEVAEATKLLENIYRAVNIALVNELKTLFDRMGIDIWEVIEAAKTKPFGFQTFFPGPGLGGHCIPIDPFYLTWKAREYDFSTRFIELAGEINTNMPYYVVQKTIDALNERGRSIKNARILLLGLAYKKDVDDLRESPSLRLIELLEEKGAIVDYNDPYIPKAPKTRRHRIEKHSVELTVENVSRYDCVVISTDHTEYDPDFILKHSNLVIDTRNLIKNYGDYPEKVKRA